jgi:multiple sugar transport system substrate-binding protein
MEGVEMVQENGEIGSAGLTRGGLLKRGLAVAGTLGLGPTILAACGGGSSGSAATKTVAAAKTVGGKLDLGGVEIKAVGDEFLGPIFEWYADDLEREANVKIGKTAKFGFGSESQAITPKLIGNSTPPWNLISYAAYFIGDFVATGNLEPLDPYFKTFAGYDEYIAGVTPVFRELYTKAKGQTYGIMVDGDCHTFHYQKQLYSDATLRKAFRQQAGRDLRVPVTWDEYLETASFFTKQLKSDKVYGTQFGSEPAVSWAYWMDVAGSMGVRYFDEQMKPQINSPAGVKALDILVKLAQFGPPGMDNMTNADTIANWQNGRIAQCVWWDDLAEYKSVLKPELVAEAPVPGSMVNGKLVQRSALAFSRCFSVPKNQPEDVKRAAAWVAYRLSHPDYSVYSVADPFCGLDPYHEAHFTREAAAQYTKANPKRGTAADYPKNDGSQLRTLAQALNHVNAIKSSDQNGFPQPNWPGTGEYLRTLGTEIQAAVAGQKTAKKAMDDAASAWSNVVNQRGKSEQLAFYRSFLASAKKLGI